MLGPEPITISTWRLIQDSEGIEECHLFLEDSTRIGALAFDTAEPDQHLPLKIPAKTLPSKVSRTTESFFYSKAILNEVTQILPCHDGHAVRGLLLKSRNGHRQALGQVRLDSLLAPMCLDKLRPVWLNFNLKAGKHPFVSEVSSINPRGNTFLRLDYCGVVEWWWSFRQCQVIFKDQKSPSMCTGTSDS